MKRWICSMLIFCWMGIVLQCKESIEPLDTLPPGVPTGLIAFGGNRLLDLYWNAVEESDVAGYKIYYGTSSENYTDTVIVGNVTYTQLTRLAEDTQYFVALSSYDIWGNESQKSPHVSTYTYFFFDGFTQADGQLDTLYWHYDVGFVTPVSNNKVSAVDVSPIVGHVMKSFGQYKMPIPVDRVAVECQFLLGSPNVGGAGLMIRAQAAKPKRYYEGYDAYLFWNGSYWELRLEESSRDNSPMKPPQPIRLPDFERDEWIKLRLEIYQQTIKATVFGMDHSIPIASLVSKDNARGRRPRATDRYCGFYTSQFGGNKIYTDNFGISRVP